LVLDENGGPNHVGNLCDAPIMIDTKNDKIYVHDSYYYIGHFSKYIKKGAKRIGSSSYSKDLETVSFKKGVYAVDNRDGDVAFKVDSSAVNLKKEGVYPVVYTATDMAGNVSVFRMTVTVLEHEVTAEMLDPLIDNVIDEIIDDGMTKKQKLRAVYDYTYDHVAYSSIADKSSWVSAAYEGLTTGQGDCYTYYALSKAFFERLGIENRDVEREQSAVIKTGERHFWNLVNIGSAEEPLWYHFDACHLNGLDIPWGFLMTDAQLDSYSEHRQSASGVTDYFYAYDKSLHPEIAKTVVTHIN